MSKSNTSRKSRPCGVKNLLTIDGLKLVPGDCLQLNFRKVPGSRNLYYVAGGAWTARHPPRR